MEAHSGRVLVIEDHDDTRELVRELLTQHGYSVDTAANGKEGLEIVHAGTRPCLILLDLLMPGMTGWEFIEKIRHDIHTIATIPVLIITGQDYSSGLQAAQGYMKKPIDVLRLLAIVSDYCPRDSFFRHT